MKVMTKTVCSSPPSVKLRSCRNPAFSGSEMPSTPGMAMEGNFINVSAERERAGLVCQRRGKKSSCAPSWEKNCGALHTGK